VTKATIRIFTRRARCAINFTAGIAVGINGCKRFGAIGRHIDPGEEIPDRTCYVLDSKREYGKIGP
jgi:hypothetical protein